VCSWSGRSLRDLSCNARGCGVNQCPHPVEGSYVKWRESSPNPSFLAKFLGEKLQRQFSNYPKVKVRHTAGGMNSEFLWDISMVVNETIGNFLFIKKVILAMEVETIAVTNKKDKFKKFSDTFSKILVAPASLRTLIYPYHEEMGQIDFGPCALVTQARKLEPKRQNSHAIMMIAFRYTDTAGKPAMGEAVRSIEWIGAYSSTKETGTRCFRLPRAFNTAACTGRSGASDPRPPPSRGRRAGAPR